MTRPNPDFASHLSTAEKNVLRPKAHNWIKDHLKKSNCWERCYTLKQTMTRKIGYCYQADMYEFLKELGFKVKIDQSGDHLAKARRKV